MFHPIAITHHNHDRPIQLHELTDEEYKQVQRSMATDWKPLRLTPIEHAESTPTTFYTPNERKANGSSFDTPLPIPIPEAYWERPNTGLSYALYSLIHLGKDDMLDVLAAMKHGDLDHVNNKPHKVIRAPIFDFCTNDKSLRDIYEYHTSLLNDGNHGIAYGKFLVCANTDWENEGVLLVDFNCHPTERGIPGVLRIDVSAIPLCLSLLEASKKVWSSLKAVELDTKWSEGIPGYTGSQLERTFH